MLIMIWFNANPAWEGLRANAAAIRAYHDERAGWARKVRGTYTRKDSDLLGLACEWGWGRHHGLDWHYKWNPGGDGGADFDGVDVKGRDRRSAPHLLVRADAFERHRVGLYASVTIDWFWRHTAVVGVMTREEVATYPIQRLRRDWPRNYVIPLGALHPPSPPSPRFRPCTKPNGAPCVLQSCGR